MSPPTPQRTPAGAERPPRTVLPALVAFLLLLLCAGCASAGAPADARAQILQADAEWSRAAQARAIDRVVSFWADDAVVFPPGSPPVVGKTAIREFVVKSFQTPGFSISWKTTDVTVSRSGELAYATGTNRVTFSGPDGRQVTIDGKAVTVWRRENGGSWRCVADIWNDVSSSPQ
jgi:uncharacterized protein (TIGR02246 family)